MLGGAISSEIVRDGGTAGTPVAMGATMALFASCALVIGRFCYFARVEKKNNSRTERRLPTPQTFR